MRSYLAYILRQLFIGMVFVTVALTSVLWLSQSLRFVDFIVNRGLDIATFFHLIMLLLPNFLLIILPIATFSAVLFTYARLINDRELVVMGAAGASPLGLATPALVVAVIVTGISYAMYLTVLPNSYRMFREFQWDLRYNYSHLLLEEGAFTDATSGITVYVRERSPDGQLRGILVHDARDPDKPYTLMAERGALVATDGGARVVLFNGSRQNVDPATHSLSMLYFERYSFDLDQTRRDTLDRFREPRERSLGELFSIRDDPQVEPRDYGQYLVEAHRRLSAPLSTLGYALVGVATLLAGRFRRRGQSRYVIAAIAIVLVLALATLGLENVASRNTAVIPMLYAINILPILLSFYALIRPSRVPLREAQPAMPSHGSVS